MVMRYGVTDDDFISNLVLCILWMAKIVRGFLKKQYMYAPTFMTSNIQKG